MDMKFSTKRGAIARGGQLMAGALVALVIVACGKPAGYPLRTCVVCDQPFPPGGPVVFVQEKQTVEVCSPEHKERFLKEPESYLKKIREAKVL